ncbi:MAG: aminotransferase class IV, partial [Pseudomonadota bacterium]
MGRTVYVNGQYVDEAEASISIFDRGFLMADGVYEVTSVLDGKLIDFAGHMVRLHRSLAELDMPAPTTDEDIEAIHRTLVEKNGIDEGLVYLQVTRGAQDRDFAWAEGMTPSLVLFTQSRPLRASETAAKGIRIVTTDDLR